jgi:serine/threonine protein kinase/CRP-like cAMP-binding protein
MRRTRTRRRHIDDASTTTHRRTDGRTMSTTDVSDDDDDGRRRRRRVSAPERASEALRGVSLFAELSDADREALCGRLVEVTYGDGEAIVTRGEVGTRFYVVAVGRVRVVGFDDDDDGGDGDGDDEEGRDAGTKKTKTLYPGETFGEVALVRRCLRTATVIAAAPVVKLWALDRATFHETLKKTTFERRCEYTDYLNLVPLFRETLDARTRSMLVDALRMATFESGSIVVSPEDAYDEEGSKFYVILRGEAVVRMDDGELTEVNRLQRGDYFGEVSLIHKTSPTATVVAIGEMTTLTLDAESFHRMIGQDTISAMAKKLESYAYASNKVERKPRRRLHRVGSLLALRGAVTSRFRWLSFERKQRSTRKRGSPESLRNNRNCVKSVTPSLIEVNSRQDVTLLKEVGGGMLGAVFLAKTLNTHTVCCVKIMHKWKILHLEQRSNVCRELQLMKTFDSPFLTRAMGSFQDAHTLFLLMEYLPGGDLFQLLVSGPFKGGKFPVDVARFYAAEVLSALEYIHANEHLYRDLKPENVLIDGSGHIKLTDFGFCRRLALSERAYTTCGTADYMAPEVMLAQGYNQSADYWSFGVLLYEMLAGYAPFASVSDGIRHRRIITSDLKFHTPYFDATAKSLISRLCIVDVSKRLGSSARGVLDLKTHDFFTEDWDVVTARRLEPPHVPTRKDAQAPHEGSVTRHRSREFYRSLDRRGERERMDAGARPLTAEASASFYGF